MLCPRQNDQLDHTDFYRTLAGVGTALLLLGGLSAFHWIFHKTHLLWLEVPKEIEILRQERHSSDEAGSGEANKFVRTELLEFVRRETDIG